MIDEHIREPVSSRRHRALTFILLLSLIFADGAQAQGTRKDSSWWPKVEKIEQQIRQGAWQKAQKSARKLVRQVLSKAWHDRELGAVLAELALYQAIAELHLDRREDAVWHWYLAQNLHPPIRGRDWTPYGQKAGEVLGELSLRREGEKPPGIEVRDLPLDSSFQPAKKLGLDKPNMLSNTGAMNEGSLPFIAEVVIDEDGHVRHPVVISTYLKPNVIYAVLEFFRGERAFEPARIDGEPVAILMPLEVSFEVDRW